MLPLGEWKGTEVGRKTKCSGQWPSFTVCLNKALRSSALISDGATRHYLNSNTETDTEVKHHHCMISALWALPVAPLPPLHIIQAPFLLCFSPHLLFNGIGGMERKAVKLSHLWEQDISEDNMHTVPDKRADSERHCISCKVLSTLNSTDLNGR